MKGRIPPPSFFFLLHDLWCLDVHMKCIVPERCIVPYVWLIELLGRMKVLHILGKDQGCLYALGPHGLKIKEMHVFRMVLLGPLHIPQPLVGLLGKVEHCQMVTLVKSKGIS